METNLDMGSDGTNSLAEVGIINGDVGLWICEEAVMGVMGTPKKPHNTPVVA